MYISASQFSGSTLASFLLNTHPNITTVGHTTGWHFGPNEKFHCSCGELMDQCEFYKHIGVAFADNGLAFDIRNFGTEFRLSSSDRANRYLTASLPFVQSNLLERLRDRIVSRVDGYSSRIARQLHANYVFMSAAMSYSDAEVFVDNSHDPYRLRYLYRIPDLGVKNIHLVRDPRGVVLSCMKHSNWSAELATRLWLRRQSDIIRIYRDLPLPSLLIFYEDLCTDVDGSLEKIHRFGNIDPTPFSGSFDQDEHHILGNAMRLRGGIIQLDERWKREMNAKALNTVASILRKYTSLSNDDQLSQIVNRYIGNRE